MDKFTSKFASFSCICRKVPKRPTAVLFTHKEDHVVISDKAGDVYRLEKVEKKTIRYRNAKFSHMEGSL